MICRDAPTAIQRAGIDLLLVDQTEPAGGSVGEHLQVPFITVCNALALNREPQIPPPFSSWSYRPGGWARLRNRVGYFAGDMLTHPIRAVLEHHRRRWGLPLLQPPDRYSSPVAQISQLVPGFEYPRTQLPAHFHFVGPIRFPSQSPVEFPWDRLEQDRPLIYASLGTLQGSKHALFRCFAEACDGLPVQLVISHGFGLNKEQATSLASYAVVVPYAPQTELLKRASATITHGGLNTVLDALAAGVPAVAVPVTFEQPAIARRLEHCGAGNMIPLGALTVRRLRAALEQLLTEPSFTQKAREISAIIARAGGVIRAADVIEQALAIRPAVRVNQ
jgi:UDP:flavonoid glycosyltransferase YjiC (YdhE family)